MTKRSLAIVAVLAVVTPTIAFAEPQRAEQVPQKARELAKRGREYHDAGDYTKAVDAYREAYMLAPSPGLLFNIAQAYRLNGDCDDAAWMYRRFLDTNPSADSRALAESHLAVVEKCGHGGLLVIVPPPIEGAVPDPNAAAPQQHEPATVVSHAREKQIGIGIAIVGVAAIAGATYFAIDAHSAAEQVTATYANGGKWSDIASIDARGHRSATIATALGIGGGAVLATGVALYAFGRHSEQWQHVAVVPTTHGAQLSSTWSF